ncbi:N-6 DNA methylase [Mariniflexile gromovii]|uniref:N-6 DNA methylase n=1 Tax=Mariniflexile gromovii TaxID=362523 RepID=A0ABS4BNQ0_9FLAO|nr:N-6 DNA methylase [Mariniflexile gromovii]MBP0902210.1 N-6 DNA methylase [Mariniflexile gromovii]
MENTLQIKDNKIYAPLLEKWLVLKPEELVRQTYILRLIDNYGFSPDQMAQELKVSNSQRGQGRAMADIAIWKSKEDKNKRKHASIVVECKAEHLTIREEDYFQGLNYATWAGADFFVTTNLKETKIFKVVKGHIPDRLDEVIDIPNANMITNAKKVDALLKQTKAFTRDEFSKLLFKCHNIIRNNDKLSPEAAFDEISKILFIKIRYERENSKAQVFSQEQFLKDKEAYNRYSSSSSRPFYQQLFENTKEEFKDDDLFDPNESIRIRENSFEAIVKELETYNLSTTSDDVKGIAFEQFLGRTFRGELGQFFTPRTIVDFMVEVLDPQEGEIICDPCCGSGGFLIKAFEYVRAKIEEDIHEEKEKIKSIYYTEEYEKLTESKKEEVDEIVNELFNKLNQELDITNPKSRLRVLSYECIFGTDANPRMSRTAKMNMIMHGDGHGGVHHNDGLLNVNGIFDNRFDVILTNPPFGSRVEKSLKITEADKYKDLDRILKYKERYDVPGNPAYTNALKQISDNIGKPLLSLYKTGTMSSLTEVLFIERCLNLLKPGGRIGIVLPEGVLNNSNLQKIRDFVESKAKIVLITSIPQDVFIASGATVKPSLLFFKKFTEEEVKQYKAIVVSATKTINVKFKPQEEEALTNYKNIETAYNEAAKTLKDINNLKGQKKGNIKLNPKEYDDLLYKVGDLKEKEKEAKKEYKSTIKTIAQEKEIEKKALIKEKFNYEIPIAEVEKAGISTTGAKIDNELEPLAKEFTEYREQNHLWENIINKVEYQIVDDKKMYRIPLSGENKAQEPEIFYN